MNRGIFLDLDGTLVKTFPQDALPNRGPRTVAEIEYLPGVVEGCRRLRSIGYELVIVTNQPDISRGLAEAAETQAVTSWIVGDIPLSASYMCPHDNGDGCCCRKPRPGLIYAAAYAWQFDLSKCWMIGDSVSDQVAADRAGVRFWRTDGINFMEAVEWILTH